MPVCKRVIGAIMPFNEASIESKCVYEKSLGSPERGMLFDDKPTWYKLVGM